MSSGSTTCVLLSQHIYINNAGYINPCAHSYPQYFDEDSHTEDMLMRNVLVHGVGKALSSVYMNKTRDQMNHGIWAAKCMTCKQLENLQIDSPRNQSNRQFSDSPLNSRIVSMDLRLGNVCNLKCRMCSPFSSVALVDEWRQQDHPMYKSHLQVYDHLNFKNWSEEESIWQELFDLSSETRIIHFAGGEPFLNRAHVLFLKKLISCGRAGSISISYNSNLSVLPDWFFEIIENFKNVYLIVSVDAVGSLNEFIRYPIKWTPFVENLKALNSYLTKNPNSKLEVSFNTTVQIYNILYLAELLDFLWNSSLERLPRVPSFGILMNPDFYSASIAPESIKKTSLQKLRAFYKKIDISDPDKGNALKIKSLIDRIEKLLSQDCPREKRQEFLIANESFDKIRKQSYFDIAPEMRALDAI